MELCRKESRTTGTVRLNEENECGTLHICSESPAPGLDVRLYNCSQLEHMIQKRMAWSFTERKSGSGHNSTRKATSGIQVIKPDRRPPPLAPSCQNTCERKWDASGASACGQCSK